METLLARTQRLVRESGIPYSQISRDTKLNLRWLTYLMRGRYEDPGVNKIERLHKYLVDQAAQRGAS